MNLNNKTIISNLKQRKVSMKEQLMLSADEAAERLNVTPAWVRRLCANGRISAVRVGNQWIVLDFNGYERTK
jgi:excisionase family DNA binding protein